ncbi:MAG: ATP-binding protein [Candidatus Margulisiibacteriota bacterium]
MEDAYNKTANYIYSKSSLKQYVSLKWITICISAAIVVLEYAFKLISTEFMFFALCALLLSSIANTLLRHIIRRGQFSLVLVHTFFLFDLLIIFAGLYLNGGYFSTWWFFPVFIIFFAGYIFGVRPALIYAALSFASLCVLFYLEYFGIIPHYQGFINLTTTDTSSFIYDYEAGMLILYLSSAMISGYFNRIVRDNSKDFEAALHDSEKARYSAEKSSQELEVIKNGLEGKVAEKLKELEGLNSHLEASVADRTKALEDSRKAIMHMMKDLKEDMEKLKTVDRMKTEFLSLISHELRTPLTPIKGYLALIRSKKLGITTDEQDKALLVIDRQSQHLESMIDNILDISRFEMGKPLPIKKEPVSLKIIIEEISEAMKIQSEEKNIQIKLDIQPDLPTIIGDSVKLKRLMSNLISNSIKFSPEKGEINLKAFSKGNDLQIEVIDHGIGVSSEYLEKVFEKFFQVDSSITRSAGGIGMGLTISREIVNQHGGKIWAESDGPGKGTRIIFTLPIS